MSIVEPSPLHLVTVARAEQLAVRVIARVASPLTDTFASQLVVTDGPGHARWLSQQIAESLGVTAGIDFLTPGQVRRRLLQTVDSDDDDVDPWSVDALTMTLVEAISELLAESSSPSWAMPLLAHLRPDGRSVDERPGRVWSTARRLATLFRRYAHNSPALVDAWDAGRSVDARGVPLAEHQSWQYEMWRRCLERAGSRHPLTVERELLTALSETALSERNVGLGWERGTLATFTPTQPRDRKLLAGLAGVLDLEGVHLIDRRGTDLDEIFAPLQRPGRTALEGWRAVGRVTESSDDGNHSFEPSSGTATMLARFQQSLVDGSPTVGGADSSVQILRSHGPNRQVEVLREALCGVLADDPSLEPRDVVIVCPDLRTYTPLLQASLGARPVDDGGPDDHPGHRLRVQVPATSGSAGPVHEVLRHLFAITVGRAGLDDLFSLMAMDPVSRRFGWNADDVERLRDLLQRARVRWGLDTTNRAEFEMPGVPQGTWLNGVERLATGVALADRPVAWLGHASPVENIEASDVRLIGSLAELVSRVRKLDKDFRDPVPATVWADRLVEAIDHFVTLEWHQQWAVTTTTAAIRRWARSRSTVPLTQRDVQLALESMASTWTPRPAFGNGSIQVVGLDELWGIPHKVVAVVGLDDACFPRHPDRLGDDLLADAGDDQVESDPRSRSQAGLLAALMSARQRLLVVHQGHDARTGTPVEPPVAITQLVEGLQRVAPGFKPRPMSLQPHSAVNFVDDPEPFSFDPQALAAAQSLTTLDPMTAMPGAESPLRWRFTPDDSVAVTLAEVEAFWRHPTRTMLQRALGTSFSRHQESTSDQVPIELWGLEEFAVGQTMLEHLVAGSTPVQAETAARLGGDVPPGEIGRRPLEKVVTAARQLAALAEEVPGPELDTPIAIEVGRWQLTGVVRLRGEVVFDIGYGKQNGTSMLISWIRLLAASVQTGRPLRSRSIRIDSRRLELQAPNPTRCRDLLVDLLQWRALGLEQALIAPARLLYDQVGLADSHQPQDQRNVLLKQRASDFRTLSRDSDWAPFIPAGAVELLEMPVHPSLDLTVEQFGHHLFDPVMKAHVR